MTNERINHDNGSREIRPFLTLGLASQESTLKECREGRVNRYRVDLLEEVMSVIGDCEFHEGDAASPASDQVGWWVG